MRRRTVQQDDPLVILKKKKGNKRNREPVKCTTPKKRPRTIPGSDIPSRVSTSEETLLASGVTDMHDKTKQGPGAFLVCSEHITDDVWRELDDCGTSMLREEDDGLLALPLSDRAPTGMDVLQGWGKKGVRPTLRELTRELEHALQAATEGETVPSSPKSRNGSEGLGSPCPTPPLFHLAGNDAPFLAD
jgi:hypothetical protein